MLASFFAETELSDGYDRLINHSEADKLLNSLLKLRQACCHPQVGVSGLRSLQQSPMTMDEILQVLYNALCMLYPSLALDNLSN